MIDIVCTALFLLLSCCTNVVFLEHMVKASPDSVNLILVFQFAFIAMEGLLYRTLFAIEKSTVPMKSYVIMVGLFFGSTLTNNLAMTYEIPMPLHMVFKSGSLITNMGLGILLFNKKYRITCYLAVFMISLGISICTIKSGWDNYMKVDVEDATKESYSVKNIVFGSFFLISSLLFSAKMGLFQEKLFKKHKRATREVLFYNHILPLPFLLFLAPSIQKNVEIFNLSTVVPVPLLNTIPILGRLQLPILWQYVAINVVTQYFCIFSVFQLSSKCSSLTVTLILTLRKFLSLVFSIYYFNNPFSRLHWVGACMVFAGTLIYSDIIGILNLTDKKKKA